MKSQLYKTRQIDVPYAITKTTETSYVSYQHIEAFPYMRWPGGQPCAPINMYFLAIASRLTGGTLGHYASQLSHITRHCDLANVSFAELSDDDIHKFSRELQEERSPLKPLERARDNNTVRQILSRTIRFLMWYQEALLPVTRAPIVGEPNSNAQIQVSKEKNYNARARQSDTYYVHNAMPPPESSEPKRPITQSTIESIEQVVNDLSIAALQKAGFTRRFNKVPELLPVHIEYMRQRRHFMIWLMKRMGLRASEMVGISVRSHTNILSEKRVLIPTKKRRRIIAPLRSFPIGLKDATVFQRYLIARNKFIEECKRLGVPVTCTDALFLGVNSFPIKKASLERDFKRLVTEAGYTDVRVCLSMFRHRFITLEVIVHLKEFLAASGKSAQIMTKTDEESILKRVATKTGHASIKSLWHYIDLAWEEINVWGGIDRALERLQAAQQFYDELLELEYQLESTVTQKSAKKLATDILAKLKSILKPASQIISREATS